MPGATNWTGLVGVWGYLSGTAGTPDIPSGAVILSIIATASSAQAGTIVIFGGETIEVPESTEFVERFFHALCTVQGPNNVADGQIVFANTASYYVSYVVPTG